MHEDVRRQAHEGKNYPCDICEKTFTRNRNLNEHKRVVHEGKNIFCELCGKSQSTKNGLNKHMKIHEGQRNYKCDYCGKSFFRFCALVKNFPQELHL